MSKLVIGIIAFIFVGIFSAGTFYIFNKSTVAPSVQDNYNLDNKKVNNGTTPTAKEKIVYTKHLGYTDKGESEWSQYGLIVSDIDGSNKEVLVNDVAADFLFIPERAEVVIIDHIGQKIEKLSLKTKERQTIFDSKSFGVEFIDDGIPGESMAILSPDKTQLVFLAGNQRFKHSKVILLNLIDHTIPARIIYSPGYSIVLSYWDNTDRIYGYAYRGTCSNFSPQFAITSSGKVSQPLFSIQELRGQNLLSPDRNYLSSLQENPQGPLEQGMCETHAYGILKLYSVKDDTTLTIESNPLKNFSAKWTSDSKYLIYKVYSYSQWSGNPTDTYIGDVQTEGFVVYNLSTKAKTILKSRIELDGWLKNNDPGASHIIKFSNTTNIERPEDKNLYIDGKIIDSVEILWSAGPAVFDVLGFIKN